MMPRCEASDGRYLDCSLQSLRGFVLEPSCFCLDAPVEKSNLGRRHEQLACHLPDCRTPTEPINSWMPRAGHGSRRKGCSTLTWLMQPQMPGLLSLRAVFPVWVSSGV